jgi:UDP-N-acetylmuramate dehydrogenase
MSGLEFLTGIPGSVGGMIGMNAGAFDHTIGDILQEIIIINEEGGLEKISAGDIEFDYRKINIKRKNYIIYEAVFNVKKDAQHKIQNLCNQYLSRRSSRFLLNALTFGSVFKNGKDYFAGELLEKCGLKGYRIGDAKISETHANFIINIRNATSCDVFGLMKIMKQKVQEKFAITLMPEVKLWGDFSNGI